MKRKAWNKKGVALSILAGAIILIVATVVIVLGTKSSKTATESGMLHKGVSIDEEYENANLLLNDMINAIFAGKYVNESGDSYEFDGDGVAKRTKEGKTVTGQYSASYMKEDGYFYCVIVRTTTGTYKLMADEAISKLVDEDGKEFLAE